jgi:hypothetical protein
MGPAIFILAIMGCGEDQTACQTVAVMPQQYQSVAACDAGIDAAVQRHIDIDYPVVVAQCLRMDATAAQALQGADVKLPPAERPAPVKPAVYKPGQTARG